MRRRSLSRSYDFQLCVGVGARPHQLVLPSAEQATNGRIEYLTRRRLVLAINLGRGVLYEIEATSGIGVRWVSAMGICEEDYDVKA